MLLVVFVSAKSEWSSSLSLSLSLCLFVSLSLALSTCARGLKRLSRALRQHHAASPSSREVGTFMFYWKTALRAKQGKNGSITHHECPNLLFYMEPACSADGARTQLLAHMIFSGFIGLFFFILFSRQKKIIVELKNKTWKHLIQSLPQSIQVQNPDTKTVSSLLWFLIFTCLSRVLSKLSTAAEEWGDVRLFASPKWKSWKMLSC